MSEEEQKHKKRGEEIPMEAYPGLAIPVPTILLSLTHQAAGGVAPESYAERVRQFHQELRRQLAAAGETYARWLEQTLEAATERATEQVLAGLAASATSQSEWAAALRPTLRAALGEWAETTGIGELLRLRGTAEVAYEPNVVSYDDVSKLTSDGRDYLASLGMQISKQGRPIQETLLLFKGALFFDLLEVVAPDWMSVYAGANPARADEVRQRVFTSANLLYAAGDPLGGVPEAAEEAAESAPEAQAQPAAAGQPKARWEGAIFFDKNLGEKAEASYDEFRAELRAACEQAHTELAIEPLSLWQRKLGASSSKEFSLRFRLPRNETLLFQLVHLLRNSGQAGRESVVKRGRMVLGRRLL
jgi:hypothetical protein